VFVRAGAWVMCFLLFDVCVGMMCLCVLHMCTDTFVMFFRLICVCVCVCVCECVRV